MTVNLAPAKVHRVVPLAPESVACGIWEVARTPKSSMAGPRPRIHRSVVPVSSARRLLSCNEAAGPIRAGAPRVTRVAWRDSPGGRAPDRLVPFPARRAGARADLGDGVRPAVHRRPLHLPRG